MLCDVTNVLESHLDFIYNDSDPDCDKSFVYLSDTVKWCVVYSWLKKIQLCDVTYGWGTRILATIMTTISSATYKLCLHE